MISSEVQRTLVKSHPELWAEISDPASLARHLGEFGEIRITRVEPEQRVEWEASDASGSVVIKPSGWGTKVKLTVTRELSRLEEPAVESAPEPEAAELEHPEPEAAEPEQPEPQAVELAQEPPTAEPEQPEPQAKQHEERQASEPDVPVDELEPQDEADRLPTPEPRRGFFARLFGRRAAPLAEPTAEDEAEDDADARAGADAGAGAGADPDAGRPDNALDAPVAERYNALAVWAAQIEPDVRDDDQGDSREDEPADAETPSDISAEMAAAEEVAAEQVTAVLSGVLDRLGSAHHRPFSRS
jgi:hypothetical protein